MKILYHHRTLAKDGMNVHIRELVAALRRCGHEVLVVGPGTDRGSTPENGRQAAGSAGIAQAVRQRAPAALSEVGELAYNLLELRRLKAAYDEFQPDVLYERYNLFLKAGTWLSRAKNLPMILEINAPLARERAEHGNLSWRRLAERFEHRVWRAAHAALPVTHVLADTVRAGGVDADRIHVIPNGVDPQRFSPEIDGSTVRQDLGLDGKIVLGFTGFVRPWHGLDRVIDFMAATGGELALELLVVGDGPAREDLEQQAARLGLGDRVHFMGTVDREHIPSYVAAFDIALQPSAVSYACPLKLVEYMAMGKAIIAPDQPNIRELVDDGETCLMVRDGDTDGLGKALLALAKKPALRDRLGGNAARKVVEEGFTWDRNALRVADLAETLMRQRRPAQ